MSTSTDRLSWDLTPIFASLDDPQFLTAVTELETAIGDLRERFDQLGVRRSDPQAPSELLAVAVNTAISELNALSDRFREIRAFVHGHVTTDSRNEEAQAANSRLAKLSAEYSKLGSRFKAWCGSLPLDSLAKMNPVVADHLYPLQQLQVESQKLMSPELEELAADLSETGTQSWARLYGNFSSQIEVSVAVDGESKTMPMSALRNLAFDPKPEVRALAYEAELDAWKRNSMVIAASFNAIKGESRMLSERRGWPSLLDEVLHNSSIDRAVLDAMQSACRDAFPVFRKYLRAKAKLLGHQGPLPWSDLFAPLGAAKSWSYEQACDFVNQHFGEYSAKLLGLSKRAFAERWVDVEPKPGKRDGAFCMGVRAGESRVLMNFKPSFGSVSTLAHELGHAYHNLCLADRTALQRGTPMTLAETASIFCETIIKRAALAQTAGEEALNILEGTLQGSCQVVVDIDSRFRFESEATERRAQRDLSAQELSDAMLRAQQATYGDALSTYHPYMWAVKPHYYGYRGFYNFPYTFGLLFGLGLYAVYQEQPKGFQERYDRLLSSTGMHDAAALGSEFGIDIRSKAFWEASLRVIGQDVDRFVALASNGKLS